MVFKIIRVGSIPAILVIVNSINRKFNVKDKNRKSNFKFIRLTKKRSKIYSWKYKKRLSFTRNTHKLLKPSLSQKILKKLYYNNKRPRPRSFRFLKKGKNYFPRRSFLKNRKMQLLTKSSFLSLLKYKNYEFGDSGSSYCFKKTSLYFIKSFCFTFLRFVPILFNNLFSNYVGVERYLVHINPLHNFNNNYIFSLGNFFSPSFVSNQNLYKSGSLIGLRLYEFKSNLSPPNSSLKYLTDWLFIFLHKFLLKRFNKNRLLGLYPVSKGYFFFNDIFFPSFSNIKVFYKSLRQRKYNNFTLNKPLSRDLIVSSKLKRSLPYLFSSGKKKLSILTFKSNLFFKWMNLITSLGFKKKKKMYYLGI